MTDQQKTNQRSSLALLLLFGGLFVLFFGLVVSAATVMEGGAPGGPGVGVVEIKGEIDDVKTTLEALRDFAEDESVKGIVVRVDSPGGKVGPSQEIYTEILRTRGKKKVVASLGAVAASGGYYAICGADWIVANPGTLTGSVGVITQLAHIEEILGLLRVQTETFKSGELKDSGSPLRAPSEADRLLLQGLVASIFEQFKKAVAKQRNLNEAAVAQIADGRVLSGEQAQALGLVNELGNFYDAVDRVKALAKIEGTPRLIYPKKKADQLLRELVDSGMSSVSSALAERLAPKLQYRLPSGL